MPRLLRALFLLCAACIAFPAETGECVYLTRRSICRDDGHSGDYPAIVCFDRDRAQLREIRNEGVHRNIDAVLASHDGRLVACRGGGWVYVLAADGSLKWRSNTGSHGMAWSPKANRLAYTTSDSDSTDFPRSTGTWIRDFDTGESHRIHDRGVLLYWGDFDSRLYICEDIQGGPTVAYNPETEEIEDTPHGHVNFSPDGKYYTQFDWTHTGESGTSPTMLVLSATQENIAPKYRAFTTPGIVHPDSLRWLAPDIVESSHPGTCEGYLIYLDTGKTLKAPGTILALSDDRMHVFVYSTWMKSRKLPIEDLEVAIEAHSGPP